MDINKIKRFYNNSSDLVIKEIKGITIIYLESICSSDKINDYILKTISLENSLISKLDDLLVGPRTVKDVDEDKVSFYLNNGFTIIIKKNLIYAVETRGNISRSISSPETQQAIYGPKDAFTENIQLNLGLIKRRIKSEKLINKDFFIGRKSNTKVSLLYMDDIVEMDLVNKVIERLNKIDIDGITDSSNIAPFIINENSTPFPTYHLIERPDTVASSLLEGKIAIIVDTSPYVIILPAFLTDFINPVSDDYGKSVNVNFIRILRFIAFLTTLLAPAIYIALINYNQETIPLSLLINFATQRDGVPFPAPFEAIVMLLLCEILRESDIRFPSSYGSSISILGALLLGDAAVNAGIVSPIMIIVVAITFITGLIFTEIEMINSTRHFRFLFLIVASFFGLYGITIAFILLLIHLCSINPLDRPYTYPLAPSDKIYFNKTILKKNKTKDKYRAKLLSKKNKKKLGDS